MSIGMLGRVTPFVPNLTTEIGTLARERALNRPVGIPISSKQPIQVCEAWPEFLYPVSYFPPILAPNMNDGFWEFAQFYIFDAGAKNNREER